MEQSCALLLSEKFAWAWDNVTLSERVTLPAKGRYPDASFIRGTQNFSGKPIRIRKSASIFQPSHYCNRVARSAEDRVKCGLMLLQGQLSFMRAMVPSAISLPLNDDEFEALMLQPDPASRVKEDSRGYS